ncbi:DNA polymerase III subunit delta' [Catenovulum agarivorans DS-2]|uniref:DNA-directed DNA polymerase n=1 Tax=Catenovulum agarivorans DS-2 TaxID=1328313 RepID=W7QLB5_9ALTE|nr:DNA polymerase III subunit delta' [Catenovulum agarivorans]EWH09717.1 DNA polymerase III subunit delta' [Catenovulum agarivorans DS-2]
MKYPWLNALTTLLTEQYQQARLHHGLLISAPAGFAKRAFAVDLAQNLLCEQVKQNQAKSACGQCKSCHLFMTQAHPDYLLVEDENAKTIGVDLIRRLVVKSQQKAQLGGAQVYIVPDCERMTEASANALLKTLEEPGLQKFIILTSSHPSRLLPTIKSRLQQYKVSPPQVSELTDWLNQAGVEPTNFSQVYPKVIASPLLALDYVKNEKQQAQKAFLAEFKALLSGKITAVQFAQQFNEDEVFQQLEWLEFALGAWLESKLKSQVEKTDAAVIRLKISDLYQQVTQCKQLMLQSGMNKKLLFSSLCSRMRQTLVSG